MLKSGLTIKLQYGDNGFNYRTSDTVDTQNGRKNVNNEKIMISDVSSLLA